MKATATAFWARGPIGTKCGRYFEAKATDRVAIVPESTTRKIVQPNRNPAIGP